MNITTALPFLSSIIMIAFTVDVFRRYARKPAHTHLLWWGIGLAMFSIGSVAEAISALVWSPVVFMSWYLFGAALNAGWLGHGTLYLLVRRKWATVLTVFLIGGSLVALALMITTPLDASKFTTSLPLSEQYREILPTGAAVRLTTPFFNIYGLLTLVGGAIYSAFLFWRKRVLPNRVIGNVLIAAGALSIGFASTLTRLGLGGYLYIGELVAAVLMYAGFIFASQPAAVEAPVPSAQNT
ncbi:MAG: hypothetical protein HY327_00380 [Chloroflexi bacterium]|nr:hypothetical protein [Chloroflexota bacterium]